MPLPRYEPKPQTRTYVEDPTAPIVACDPLDDETLRRILRETEVITVRIPGLKGRLDRSIMAFSDECLALTGLRHLRERIPVGVEDEVVGRFQAHRRDVRIRTGRHLLVGTFERGGPDGPQRVAVLMFVDHKIRGCTIRPQA